MLTVALLGLVWCVCGVYSRLPQPRRQAAPGGRRRVVRRLGRLGTSTGPCSTPLSILSTRGRASVCPHAEALFHVPQYSRPLTLPPLSPLLRSSLPLRWARPPPFSAAAPRRPPPPPPPPSSNPPCPRCPLQTPSPLPLSLPPLSPRRRRLGLFRRLLRAAVVAAPSMSSTPRSATDSLQKTTSVCGSSSSTDLRVSKGGESGLWHRGKACLIDPRAMCGMGLI